MRRTRDHPDDRNADRQHLAGDQVEYVRADPKIRALTTLEGKSAAGTMIREREPVPQNATAATARASKH
jgi:hypothetical protein